MNRRKRKGELLLLFFDTQIVILYSPRAREDQPVLLSIVSFLPLVMITMSSP
jgi:hypothetical protein